MKQFIIDWRVKNTWVQLPSILTWMQSTRQIQLLSQFCVFHSLSNLNLLEKNKSVLTFYQSFIKGLQISLWVSGSHSHPNSLSQQSYSKLSITVSQYSTTFSTGWSEEGPTRDRTLKPIRTPMVRNPYQTRCRATQARWRTSIHHCVRPNGHSFFFWFYQSQPWNPQFQSKTHHQFGCGKEAKRD